MNTVQSIKDLSEIIQDAVNRDEESLDSIKDRVHAIAIQALKVRFKTKNYI